MACRCTERREALTQSVRAIAQGDHAQARAAIVGVGRTTVEDVAAMAQRMAAVGGTRRMR